MPTASELAAHMGRVGTMTVVGALRMRVKVIDARANYNRLDYRVAPEIPAAGDGDAWVFATRVELDDPVPTKRVKR